MTSSFHLLIPFSMTFGYAPCMDLGQLLTLLLELSDVGAF